MSRFTAPLVGRRRYGPRWVNAAPFGNPWNGTLTDYTVSGTTVNLAQAPLTTATTTWSGYAT